MNLQTNNWINNPKTPPQALIFDMGGVLCDSPENWNATSFKQFYSKKLPNSTPIEQFLALSDRCFQYYVDQPVPRQAIDCTPIIYTWIEKQGYTPTPDEINQWAEALCQWELRPIYPYVRPTLETLTTLGLRIGLISNTVFKADAIREHFKRNDIIDYFEFMIFSAEYGMNKPHPSIFQSGLDTLKVDAGSVWFIGDKPQRDICGAKKAGMISILSGRQHRGRISDNPDFLPDAIIQDIRQLPDLITYFNKEFPCLPSSR